MPDETRLPRTLTRTLGRPKRRRTGRAWLGWASALSWIWAVLLLGAACAPGPQWDLVIEGVRVVDAEAGELSAEKDVWIHEGRIVAIEPAGVLRAEGGERVDGAGRYLMAGLVDAHVHVDHPDELEVYPAYGVTGLFVLRGLPQHLQWREEIAAGSRFGPRLLTTGDYMDGYPPMMQPMMSFEEPADAAGSVADQKEAGYDFLKVYTRLSAEQLTAISEAAAAEGLCFLGHGGRGYPLEHVVASGQANLAHGQDLIRWYFEGQDDPTGVARVVEALAGSRTTVTPNLSFTQGLIRQGAALEELLASAPAAHLHPALLQPVRRENNRYVQNAEQWVPEVRARLEVEKELTLRLHEAGVTLLAGTDASTSGVFPGDSLHRELALLVEAGLSPAEAIAAATVAPAELVRRCVDSQELAGRVAENHRADLVLLTDNPLEDISATRQIAGVVLAGQWHSRTDLDGRLSRLEAEYAALQESVVELERFMFGGDHEAASALFATLRAERPDELFFSQYVPFFAGYGYLYGESGFNEDPERLAAALGLYELYAESYPDRHSSHYQLGLARLANGMTAEAEESFRRAVEIHPYYPDARRKLAELAGEEGAGP